MIGANRQRLEASVGRIVNTSSSKEAFPGSTDNALLHGIRDHDQQAWSTFVEAYSPLVYLWCRRCDLQPADAADVSQQVFYSVNRSIDTFSNQAGHGGFRAWLWTITRNAIRNYLSRTLRGPNAQGGTSIQIQLMQQPEAFADDPLSSSSSSSDFDDMKSVIESVQRQFNDRTWQCFWMVAMQGRTAAEVAAELDMNVSAVRQAKYRVAQRFRQELKDFQE